MGTDRDQRSGGGEGEITDRECDAPHELLLIADAHLWSVSGGRGRCLLNRESEVTLTQS